jgi:hypothetical protein
MSKVCLAVIAIAVGACGPGDDSGADSLAADTGFSASPAPGAITDTARTADPTPPVVRPDSDSIRRPGKPRN